MISRRLIVSTSVIIILSILFFLFGLFPGLVEKYYSTGVYPYISSSLRYISSVFPFAIGDMIYILLIGFVLFKIIRFYKRKKFLTKQHRIIVPLQILNFFLILYIIFKVVWGLNYARPSVSKTLGIDNEKYSVKELVSLGDYFIKKTNDLKLKQTNLPHYTIDELALHSANAYKAMELKNQLFRYSNPALKSAYSDWLISKLGIEGYYAPLSGEANLNMNLPDFIKPYVACHEIAHQLGIAYEDEANLVGYLTANHSTDLNFKYSANYEMLRYILFEIRIKSPKDYKILHDQLSIGVLADFKTEKEFCRKYNGQMFAYMDATFDRFLKLNNQKKGTDSYQDIVVWLWNIYKSEVERPKSDDKT